MKKVTSSVGSAAFVLGLSVSAAFAADTKTVRVDCAKGQSINEALETKAAELIVEVRGLCEERVVVRRDHVTLLGADPELDGIVGPGPSAPTLESNALLIRDAQAIRVENLKITGAERRGVQSYRSAYVELVNCRVVDNNRLGVVAGGGGEVVVRDSVVSGNPRGAVIAWSSSGASVYDSELSDSYYGLLSALGGSQIQSHDSTVSATWPVVAGDYGLVYVFGGELVGGLWAENNGTIDLYRVEQSANPGGYNLVDLDSTLRLSRGNSILGTTYVEDFSRVLVEGDSTHAGDLACASGGDAYCADPSKVGGSSCARCVVP